MNDLKGATGSFKHSREEVDSQYDIPHAKQFPPDDYSNVG